MEITPEELDARLKIVEDFVDARKEQQISLPLDDVSRKILEQELTDILKEGLADITATVNGLVGIPVGAIMPFPYNPGSGWQAATGGTMSRTGVGAALFAVYGTTFGVGDGSTTFGLPDATGRVLVQIGGSGVVNPGDTGGVQTNTISKSTLPADSVFSTKNPGQGLSGIPSGVGYGADGGGGSLDNMMPYLGIGRFYIKL